jgi:hypothetical protein
MLSVSSESIQRRSCNIYWNKQGNIKGLDTDGSSVYPCRVLNRFACPYDKKIVVDEKDITGEGITKKPDVDYLFYLSELAFSVELALGKAQEEDSVFWIKSVEGVYHTLTNKETLEKVLHQGLTGNTRIE